MSIVSPDTDGLRQALDVLAGGRPIVAGLPSPLPYVLAGTDPRAVNTAKGRPAEQPLGLGVVDVARLRPHVALDDDALALARRLTAEHRLNLLLPATGTIAAWLRPSVADGWLAITLAWPERLRPLLDRHGHLYLSSANRTTTPVAVTAAAANDAFDDALLVVDGGPDPDPATARGSATILRVHADRRLEIVRPGIQDTLHGGTPDEFLRDLAREVS